MVVNKVQLKSDAIFDKIKDRLAENPAKGKQINAVFLYKITTTTSNGAPVKHWSKKSIEIDQKKFQFEQICRFLILQSS